MNFFREYFIGDYLRTETNVLRQASIRLVFNLVFISIMSLCIFFVVYLTKGFHYLLIKNVAIIMIFVSLLFYVKVRKSIDLVCHLLILVSWLNNNVNIYLFNEFHFFTAWLTVMNIIFAFHTLGSRAGFFYSFLHFVPIFT